MSNQHEELERWENEGGATSRESYTRLLLARFVFAVDIPTFVEVTPASGKAADAPRT